MKEALVYDKAGTARAWRLFVTQGKLDEDVVRPEVARSWRRCKAAGLNPWSSGFPTLDENLLKEKRARYSRSLEANQPVMKMLLSLLQCNVSLQDQENFVFEFFSPLGYYPRTMGTQLKEEEVGTGNATIVGFEKKAVRVDGFEHYRTIAQGYSGVSAPFLDPEGKFYGSLNLNSPFGPLPQPALEMCKMGVSLVNGLFVFGRSMWARLKSLDYFQPLVELLDDPVLVVDARGNILLANKAMTPFVKGFEDLPYGSQPVAGYLGKTSLQELLTAPFDDSHPLQVFFKAGRRKPDARLDCVHRNTVQFKNGVRFTVMVFHAPRGEEEKEKGAGKKAKAKAAPKRKEQDYVGASEAWLKVDRVVDRIATVNANVLILGETGTGKELVARAIHRRSKRSGNFIAINCGAIPRDLFSAELFGYEAGAFTGAKEEGALGKIEAANHGTLLLDEIGEMPPELQVGLLRVIQEQAVTRLGASEPRPLDVRFLAATNQDVREMIERKRFRADLYYRLSTIEITLPPLRDRDGDAVLLADHFNREASKRFGIPYSPFSKAAQELFRHYSWPGNVRELRNVVERSLIIAGEGAKVTPADLPSYVANARSDTGLFGISPLGGRPVAEASSDDGGEGPDDRDLIAEALLGHGGDPDQTAKALGMSTSALQEKMAEYRLTVTTAIEVDGVPFQPADGKGEKGRPAR